MRLAALPLKAPADRTLMGRPVAALWGLSLDLHEGTFISDGQVRDRNLNTYTPLRMGDVPALDIEFVASDEFPAGLGEPPLSVVAPAIANAIFQATGVRPRDLPIRKLS